MIDKLDYISVLASGKCEGGCRFCIGRNSLDHSEPHFASTSAIYMFLKKYQFCTRELSISGSNTDPLYTDTNELEMIVRHARENLHYKVSLHTHVFSQSTQDFYGLVDELCVSINNRQDMLNFIDLDLPLEKIRISTVVTSENLRWLETNELFRRCPVEKFTVRKNVFEPDIRFPYINRNAMIPSDYETKNLFGNMIYKRRDEYFNNISYIAEWDYRNTNKNTKAKYLWANNTIHDQDYWQNFK